MRPRENLFATFWPLLLAMAISLWFLGYLVLLRGFVPRMRDRSKEMSEARSLLTGRIVDSYTNILTVKLFARPWQEDAYVREAVDEHTGSRPSPAWTAW